MENTTLDDLVRFIKYWNNEHLSNGRTRPFNDYLFEAWDVGLGFTLKWFVKKEDFDKLVEDLKYEFKPGEDKNRLLLECQDDRIEFEVDNRGVLNVAEKLDREFREKLDTIVAKSEQLNS